MTVSVPASMMTLSKSKDHTLRNPSSLPVTQKPLCKARADNNTPPVLGKSCHTLFRLMVL